MRICCDFGHGVPYDGGAIGILNEEKVVREYGPLVISKLQALGHEVLNVTPSTATSLGNSLSQRTTAANNWGADLFVCCHANSFSSVNANGCEVEYLSSGGKTYADKIVNELAKLGYTNRGSVLRNNLYVLNRTNAVAVLIEPFFVTNSADCSRYNAEKLANAIVKGITGQDVPAAKPTQTNSNIGSRHQVGEWIEVLASVLNVRNAPSGSLLGTVKKGESYRIAKVDGNWAEIYWGDHGGWICLDYVR